MLKIPCKCVICDAEEVIRIDDKLHSAAQAAENKLYDPVFTSPTTAEVVYRCKACGHRVKVAIGVTLVE